MLKQQTMASIIFWHLIAQNFQNHYQVTFFQTERIVPTLIQWKGQLWNVSVLITKFRASLPITFWQMFQSNIMLPSYCDIKLKVWSSKHIL